MPVGMLTVRHLSYLDMLDILSWQFLSTLPFRPPPKLYLVAANGSGELQVC